MNRQNYRFILVEKIKKIYDSKFYNCEKLKFLNFEYVDLKVFKIYVSKICNSFFFQQLNLKWNGTPGVLVVSIIKLHLIKHS